MANWIVTGANRGIGLELARQLTDRGDAVVATARQPEEATELRATGCHVLPLDIGDPVSIAAFADHLGDEPVDVLVNNAGMGVAREGFEEQDWDELRRSFDVNTIGPMRVTAAVLKNLRAGERRTVVNVTSKMGSIADNTTGHAYAYRASKAALNALTKSMAIDLGGDGFKCVVVHPGWVATRMGGAAAPLSADESVRGLLKLIDGLEPEQSGRFFNFDGEELPW